MLWQNTQSGCINYLYLMIPGHFMVYQYQTKLEPGKSSSTRTRAGLVKLHSSSSFSMVKLDPASLARLRPYPKTMLMFGNVVPLLLYGRLWPSFGLALMLGAFVCWVGGIVVNFILNPILVWFQTEMFWYGISEIHFGVPFWKNIKRQKNINKCRKYKNTKNLKNI